MVVLLTEYFFQVIEAVSNRENGEVSSSEVVHQFVEDLPTSSPKILVENVDYEQVEFFNSQRNSDELDFEIQTIEVSVAAGNYVGLNEQHNMDESNQESVGGKVDEEDQELVSREEEIIEAQELVVGDVVADSQELVDREEGADGQELMGGEVGEESQELDGTEIGGQQLVGREVEIEGQDLVVGDVGADGRELVGGEVDDQTTDHEYTEPIDVVPFQGRPKKGRKRKIPDQSRADRQKRCRTNQDYINAKGTLVESKEFRDYQCSCKCNEKVSTEDRKKEFIRFWSLETLSAKCLFVCSKVSVKPVNRKRVVGPTVRSNTRVYSLAGQPVCKAIFLQTLRISSCRVNKYLLTQKNLEPIKDNRGQQGGSNKLPQNKEDEVVNHINRFPKYKSHYCRERNDGKQYLTSETTLPLMYSMYKEEHPDKPVSISKYKQIFYSKFNLTRKALKKDTCNKCDSFSAQMQSATSEVHKEQIRLKHEEHLKVAEGAQTLMKEDLKRAQENDNVEVLTFDMQKTLPLPRIPTNIVFYKRQLWLYNLGVHSGKQDKGYCYTWLEGEAGRGAQEVGSCIIKHLKTHLNEGVKELIVWSDSCGGQNRNIKMVLLFKSIFKSNPHLETIRMRYLVPGHTFLPNDSEFGDIECALKKHNRLYTPDDYINVILNARNKNKFVVSRMLKENFFSSQKLEKAITNRKKFVDGSKVNWLQTREIVLIRDRQLSVGLSTTFNDVPKTLDLQKRDRNLLPRRSTSASNEDEQNVFDQRLDQLWPNGKPITVAKLADLKSLLHLIPGDAKRFYTNLTADRNAGDDIEGFGGWVDFDVDPDEEED